MNEKDIETYSDEKLDDMRKRGEGKTDWKRLAEMTDEDHVFDIPEIEDDACAIAKEVIPELKKKVSIKIDREALEYFRKDGSGYQKRMSAALKSFVRAHQEKKK